MIDLKKMLLKTSPFLDLALCPLTLVGGAWLKFLRHAMKTEAAPAPLARMIFRRLGVFPIIDNFDEPLFASWNLSSLENERSLTGIDFNVDEQLEWLNRFVYEQELRAFPLDAPPGAPIFHYRNGFFEAGDAEYLYSLLRTIKPRKMVEIGSGYSTLMAAQALEANRREDPSRPCEHVAIEPYANPWLEKLDVALIRERVELVAPELILDLSAGDVLFIDTSHIIRPQGDVLFLFLEILPRVPEGVFVHVHDIFTPWDYPTDWLVTRNRFYNEQYLLEAFLSLNPEFRIIGALHFLKRKYPKQLFARCPILASETERRPGSLWMRRTGK